MGISLTQSGAHDDRVPIDIFVVSANPKLRQSLQEKLASARWNVIEAGSGAGALELLHNHGSDDGVLLLDPILPDLEPNEFQGILRARYPNTQVLTLNSHTGQLLIGNALPTAAGVATALGYTNSGLSEVSLVWS